MGPNVIVSLILAIVLSSCSSEHLEVDNFRVGYEIRYNDPYCFVDQSPIPPTTVMIDPQSTALNVMEASVLGFDPTYRFSATYFGAELGYFIEKIGNVASNLSTNCFWIYYIISETVGGDEVSYAPNFGVSNFLIPASGTRMVWSYKFIPPGNYTPPVNSTASNSSIPDVDSPQFVNDTHQGPGTFLITYIVSRAFSCFNRTELMPPITVSIPRGGSALNVMENARDISVAYAFSATYFGVSLGYLIDSIGETYNNDVCSWQFLYWPPFEEPYAPNRGVSNFVLPVDGGTVIMSYTNTSEGQQPPTASMPTDDPTEDPSRGNGNGTMTTSDAGYVQPLTLFTFAVVISTTTGMLFY